MAVGCGADADRSPTDWLGHSEIELRHAWGEPTEEKQTDTGQTVTYVSYWNRTPVEILTCRQAFSIDTKGRIIAHAISGCSQ